MVHKVPIAKVVNLPVVFGTGTKKRKRQVYDDGGVFTGFCLYSGERYICRCNDIINDCFHDCLSHG